MKRSALENPLPRKEAPTLNRDDWVGGGLRQLARGGIDAVSIAPLARELGVTKGSFYWHFRDRQDLLDAMLARWERTDAEIATEVQSDPRDTGSRLRLIIELSVSQIGGRLETALRDWAGRDETVRAAVERIDQRRLAELRRQFGTVFTDPEEAEARAWLLYSMLTGVHLIAARPPRGDRKELMLNCLEVLLRGP